MNHYGDMARAHWARWLPARYAQIEDLDSYFTSLGLEVAQRIGDLMLELAGSDPAGEDYLTRVVRLGQARHQAEEIVLAEMVLLEPEPAANPEPAPDTARPHTTPDVAPAVIRPSHPLWEQVNAEQTERLHGS